MNDTNPESASIFRPGLFTGKVALVTGGATGIGLACAEEFVRLGGTVAIASRKMNRLIPAAKGLSRDYGGTVEPFTVNIRDRAQCEKLFDEVLAHFGKVDFLVNNGGGQFATTSESLNEKGWKAVIVTNLNGTWNMCQVAGEKWMYRNGGRIVNIVADMWNGFPGMVHTGAARAGVVNLTMTLAVEWAKYRIRINAVAPGAIASTGFNNYPAGMMDQVWKNVPLKQFGSSEDIARSVLFLCSPGGDFIHGTTLRVDGGGSLWGDHWPIPDPPGGVRCEIPPWPEQRWPEFAVADDGGTD